MKKSIGSSKIVVEETNNEGEKPMLYFDDIKVEFESQEFKGIHMEISLNKDKSVLFLESVRSMQTVRWLFEASVFTAIMCAKLSRKNFLIKLPLSH